MLGIIDAALGRPDSARAGGVVNDKSMYYSRR